MIYYQFDSSIMLLINYNNIFYVDPFNKWTINWIIICKYYSITTNQVKLYIFKNVNTKLLLLIILNELVIKIMNKPFLENKNIYNIFNC